MWEVGASFDNTYASSLDESQLGVDTRRDRRVRHVGIRRVRTEDLLLLGPV